MTLTAPAIELRPNSVPCGPFTTSARSTSYIEVMTPPVRPDQMPSTNIATEGSPPMPKSLVEMPRIESASVKPSSVLPLKPGVKSTIAADVGHAAFLQHLAGEGGHRERHVLQRLLALLRRDHDFLEADDLLWLGCRLRCRRRLFLGDGCHRTGQRGDDGHADRGPVQAVHASP